MGVVELFIVLLIAAAVVATLAHWIRFSPSLALLIFGLVLGSLDLVRTVRLSSEIILLLFLPPLLFEAAFVIDLRMLWSTRLGVLLFSLPGVIIAMLVAGAMVHWGTGLGWSVALLFGAMIAATDPVAVLATFRQLQVERRLTVLLEGESLFNDGTALILVATLVEAVDDDLRPAHAVLRFVIAIEGGVVIGLLLGALGHLLIARIDDHLTEMTISVAVAYGAFLMGQRLDVSAVFATLIAAMTLGRLGRRRGWVYSDGSESLLTDLWDFLAFVANAALFLLMGLSAPRLLEQPRYVIWGILAALVGRAIVVYGLGGVLPRLGFPLPLGHRHVLFWGGLRGAVALAAVLSLPEEVPYRTELRSMTFGVVLFTLLVQGTTIGPLVRRLGLQRAPSDGALAANDNATSPSA